MHKTPLKLLSSTFSPSLPFSLPMPPLLRLGARRRRPASSPSTGARGRRCPSKLADIAAPWSSRTSRSPPLLEFAAAPLARRSNSRAMCGGDGACGPRPRGHRGGRQTPLLSHHYLRANAAPPRHARRRRRCSRLPRRRRRRRSSRPPHAPRQHGSQLPRRPLPPWTCGGRA